DRLVGGDHGTIIVDPAEPEGPAALDLCSELDERIGCDSGFEVGGEHALAIKVARELVDDLARDRVAALVLAEPGLHRMRQERLDLDNLAFFGFLWNLSPRRRCHDALLNLFL